MTQGGSSSSGEVNRPRWAVGRCRAAELSRGESLAEAVVREVKEETGLIVSVGSFLGWAERLTEAHHYVILDFAAAPIGGLGSVDATLRAGDDASEAAWVLIEDLDRTDLVDGLRTFLREVGVA